MPTQVPGTGEPARMPGLGRGSCPQGSHGKGDRHPATCLNSRMGLGCIPGCLTFDNPGRACR